MLRMLPALVVLAAGLPVLAEVRPGAATAQAPEAAPPVAAAEAPAPSPVLAYVPDDAVLAVHVRMAQLAATQLWKTFASPSVAVYRDLAEGLPVTVDLGKDCAAVALVLDVAYDADGRPDTLRRCVLLEMNREVRPTDLAGGTVEDGLLPGSEVTAHRTAGDDVFALPRPRLVLIGPREALARIVKQAGRPRAAADRLPVEALAAPGEVTWAARMPPEMKDAVLDELSRFRRDVMRPHMTTDRLMEFAWYYNLARVTLQAEALTGTLDLAREVDALRAEVRFESPAMAPFLADLLQAMADPLAMGLPAVLGGQPLAEPGPTPLYRATHNGRTVHLTMTRGAAYRFVSGLAQSAEDLARREAARRKSAENLRALAIAIEGYVARRGEYPRTWSDLVKADLIRDPGVFVNPALETHLPGGDYELLPLTKAIAAVRPWERVLAYEAYPGGETPPRLNVLLADGHVEDLDRERFQHLYQETLERLGR